MSSRNVKETKSSKSPPVTGDELNKLLGELLSKADLSVVTSKMLRRQLETALSFKQGGLDSRKSELNGYVDSHLARMTKAVDKKETNSDKKRNANEDEESCKKLKQRKRIDAHAVAGAKEETSSEEDTYLSKLKALCKASRVGFTRFAKKTMSTKECIQALENVLDERGISRTQADLTDKGIRQARLQSELNDLIG